MDCNLYACKKCLSIEWTLCISFPELPCFITHGRIEEEIAFGYTSEICLPHYFTIKGNITTCQRINNISP